MSIYNNEMSRFEMIGCDHQDQAETVAQAKRAFEHSCKLCAERGRYQNCNSCKIARQHDIRVTALEVMAETPDFH